MHVALSLRRWSRPLDPPCEDQRDREGPTIAVAPTATTLTPEQRAIVEFGDGPAVVIAGAGTGKTRVIVERVAWLLATKPDLAPE